MQSTRCISRRRIFTACTDCNTCTGGGGSYDASTGIYTGPDGKQAYVGPDGSAC